MSVKIRLARAGAKKKPFYRVVVTDSRNSRDGRFIERVGTYDPKKDPSEILLQLDRIDYWLGVGGKPSDTVKRLINKARRQALTGPVEAAAVAAKPAAAPEAVVEAKAEAAPVAGETSETSTESAGE